MTSCSSCYPSARPKCTKSQFNEVPQPHALLAECLIWKIKIKPPTWQLYNAFLCSLSLTNLLQASHKGTVDRKGSLSPVPGNQKDCLRVLRRWLRTALWEFWFPSQYSTVHHWPHVIGRKAFILCATDRRQVPRKCTVLPGSLFSPAKVWLNFYHRASDSTVSTILTKTPFCIYRNIPYLSIRYTVRLVLTENTLLLHNQEVKSGRIMTTWMYG